MLKGTQYSKFKCCEPEKTKGGSEAEVLAQFAERVMLSRSESRGPRGAHYDYNLFLARVDTI